MFFSARSKDPRYKPLNTYISSITGKDPSEFKTGFKGCFRCVPDFTDHILDKTLTKMIEILSNDSHPVDLQITVLDLLTDIVTKADDKRGETLPWAKLKANAFFLGAVFNQVQSYGAEDEEDGQEKKERFQKGVKLLNFLWISEMTPDIQDFIMKQDEAVAQIVDLIGSTRDLELTNFFARILSSKPEILEKHMLLVKERLPYWHPSPVISIWIGELETRDVIPTNQLKDWLLQSSNYIIDDIDQVTIMHPFLWDDSAIIVLMSRTLPDGNPKNIQWIRKRKIQNIDMNQDEINEVAESLFKPLLPLTPENRTNFYYIRFFALTQCDPKLLPEGIIEKVTESINDQDETVAIAAIQTLVLWSERFGYEFPLRILYRAATAAVDRPGPLEMYAKALIHYMASRNEAVARALACSPEIRFDISTARSIATDRAFPAFAPLVRSLKPLGVADVGNTVEALGALIDALAVEKSVEMSLIPVEPAQ